MPRSSGSNMPQRQSPRGPQQLRTSSSDSDPQHHRPVTDRKPKLADRRSPRGSQPDTLNQKKLGTRIADLETQLGQAQKELKNLKEQLVSAEAAKKEAQDELEKKDKKPVASESEKLKEKCTIVQENHDRIEIVPHGFTSDENLEETDVFEVPVEKLAIEIGKCNDEVEKESKSFEKSVPRAILEPEKPSVDDELSLKNDEIIDLKSKLEENEKELEFLSTENENLKSQLIEAVMKASDAQTKEEGINLKMKQFGEELDTSKANADKLDERLKSVEAEKEALETEMKKLRVQTEQWKKAADVAAAVLAGGVDMNSRISQRCGSMDKHFRGVFETPAGGYNGFVGSPSMNDDLDDSYGSGKRKGSGIRMFGDLWKKKGQK